MFTNRMMRNKTTDMCISFAKGEEEHSRSVPEGKMILRYAEVNSVVDERTMASQQFADIIKEKTKGRIEIHVFSDGALGDNKSVVQNLMIGAIDMRYIIPPVICCLVLGAFGLRNNMFDVYVMLTIVCYVFSKQIVRAFLSNGEAFTYGLGFTRIYLSTSFLFGLYYVLLNALQAMGAAKASLIVNLSRQGLVFIPLMFLFQAMIGINGLVWAQPVADLISTMLVALLYVRAEKKLMADVLS